jgi:hypothetical protein
VHLELALQILPADVGDGREPRRQARGVEQAVETAEFEHRSAEEGVERGIIADVGRGPDQAAGMPDPELGGDLLGRGPVEVRHHHVRALLCEASRGRLADAAPAADDHHDVPRKLLGGPLAGDGLLHLPALQRPVLELEHVALGEEFEPVQRFGALDRLEGAR